MWLSRASLEDFFSDFFLHHDSHLMWCMRYIIEKMEEDRTRNIIWYIRDDRVVFIYRCECENILVMYRERDMCPLSTLSFREDGYHIRIELYEIERERLTRDDIFCERSIPRSYLDDMFTRECDRARDIRECFWIDEEVLSE